MAYSHFSPLISVGFLVSLTGCFNPGGGAIETDSDGTDSANTDNPSTMTSMTMTTDATGGMTMTGTVDDTGDTGDTTAGTDVADDPPECTDDIDCADMAGECEVATCDGGACAVGNQDAGSACGDRTETGCDLADTCDGNGSCSANEVADGSDCFDCDSGQCLCNGGSCGECVTFADTNLFTTARSLNGWTMTGDWGLYTEAPFAASSGPAIPFGNQVLGTDGNRHFPYPGGHAETSYARTPPTELPSSLTFQSWHLDEGSGSYDNKIIRISTNGGASWTDIISCPLNPALPFCQSVFVRASDDWDSISLDLPAPLIGQVGIIEFAYDTFDSCCDFEKGWFIDVTNFATECACTADAVCEPYGGECGTGACGGNGGCNLDAVAAATVCGDDADDVCTQPDGCDGFGYCQPRHIESGPVIGCTDCAAGQDCDGCAGGVCTDCVDNPAVNDFAFPPFPSPGPLGGWSFNQTSGGAWNLFFSLPNNEDNDGTLASSGEPFLGIDGSTVGAIDGVGEINNAAARTRPDIFTDTLTFDSWHQDQGGPSVDIKRIELSIDGGAMWIPLADCSAGAPLNAFPFCSLVDNRDPENWDAIEIDTTMWEDMEGELRFSYNTVNACCGFERGWFIDNLSFAQSCASPNLTQPNIECQYYPQDFCEDDSFCAWDEGASECISCAVIGFGGGEAACNAEPLCEWFLNLGGGGGGICHAAPE